jgi:hypothetical protein
MSSEFDDRRGVKILEEVAGVRRLPDLSVLSVTGDDTRSWLNGQLTNDVRDTKPGQAVYALAVTVKGKILADVWVYDRGQDRFWLAVPTSAVPALLASFEAQIIMEDVDVEDDVALAVVAVVGPAAPDVVNAVTDLEGRVFSTTRLSQTSRDVIVASGQTTLEDALITAAEALGGGAVTASAWELARLRARAPRYPVDFDARNYPQEAGLKDRAVSFQKGCYLGQEVVCMLETRGKLSKRLVLLAVDGADAIAADTTIADDAGKDIGRVTSSVQGDDGTLALGYVKAAFAEKGRVLSVGGRSAEVRDLAG